MSENLPRITLLGSHHDQLISFFQSHKAEHECAAVVLFRRLHRPVPGLQDSDRYLSCEVIPFPDEWITDSSPSHIDYIKAPLRELYRKCKDEDLVFGFIHNHPTDHPEFSERDFENEISLLQGLVNRNGVNSFLVAMLWTQGEWIARVRDGHNIQEAIDVRHTLVVSDRLDVYGSGLLDEKHDEILARQSAAFGRPFSAKLNSLRVVVIGAGGTGSPVATLLARSGVGELISIDFDPFEKSNLNRVRGSRARDDGKNKAQIQRDFINELGVPCQVVAVDGVIDTDYDAVVAMSSADTVFGCTDDWAGRDILNKAVYYYALPLIDLGLGGIVDQGRDGHPVLRNHSGRISCVMPESGACLYCQDVLRPEWVAHQLAVRKDPDRAEQDVKDGYLEGGGVPAPGVGPFTGATADFAVATLFDLIKPYRKLPPELRKDNIFLDFVKMRMKSNEVKNNPDCPYCRDQQYLAKGEHSYLLGRPALKPRKE